MSPLEDLKKRFTDVNFTAAPVVLGRYPATPDAIVSLRELPTPPPKDYDANNDFATGVYRILLTARVQKDAGAKAALQLAWDAMRAVSGRHIPITRLGITTVYHYIRPVIPPFLEGYDQNDRPEATATFLIERAERLP
jgi:hypothetical protein